MELFLQEDPSREVTDDAEPRSPDMWNLRERNLSSLMVDGDGWNTEAVTAYMLTDRSSFSHWLITELRGTKVTSD